MQILSSTKTVIIEQENLPSIIEFFLSKVSNDSYWRTESSDAGAHNHRKFFWFIVRHKSCKKIHSGWKIHISASLQNAIEILNIVTPILLSFKFTFKITKNLDFLAYLNNGSNSKQQVGKFITIYPDEEKIALELMQVLHKATQHLKSPRIMTDIQFKENSIIYYRYGAFLAEYCQTLWGSLLPLMEIQGKKVFDFKNPHAEEYKIINNPFQEEASQKENNELVLPQGLIKCAVLLKTSTTETLLCLDVKNKRRCILKISEANTATDTLENDAASRLEIEAYILKQLSLQIDGVPQYYSSMWQGTEAYCLIMEDVAGINLHSYLQNRISNQKPISMRRLIKIANNLARIIMEMHDKEIIHADLKLGNIILLANSHIKLIDFNSACDVKNQKIIATCGSIGFSTINRSLGNKPAFSDDIYGYGAVLYYLFGQVNPDIRPLENGQKKIELRRLNQSIPHYIEDLVNACLSETINNFKEIIDCLRNKKCNKNFQLSQTKEHDDNYLLKLQFLERAYLLKGYDEDKHSYEYSPVLIGMNKITDLRGVAGTVLALSTSFIATASTQYLDDIRVISKILLQEKLPYNTIPGLYVGESGKALALLYAAHSLNDKDLLESAELRIKDANDQPFQSVDLFNGLAGRLRVNLIFYLITKNNYYLTVAEKMVSHLCSVKVETDQEIFWYNPTIRSTADDFCEDKDHLLLGYAHGVAGIADSLLDYYLIVPQESTKHLLIKVVKYLIALAVPCLAGAGLWWSDEVNNKPLLSFWCHGGAGIGVFIARAMRYKIIEQNDELIKKIILPMVHFAKGGAPILCHGIAGTIESLLDIASHCPQLDFSMFIRNFERILSSWLKIYVDNGFKTVNVQFAFYGYLTGIAGIIALYCRLANKHAPNPLHIEFAQYLMREK